MTALVHLHDTTTDERAVYVHELEDGDADLALYMWDEGNYACDCNRRRFMWRLLHPGADEPDFPCGDGHVRVEQIVDAETGHILAGPEDV